MLDNAKVDRRILRTKRALWGAMMELLHDQNWDEINIQMICARADVARSSFYKHFGNKAALLDFGFEGTQRDIEELIVAKSERGSAFVTLDWFVDHIAADARFFERVFQSAANYAVFLRLKKAMGTAFAREILMRGDVAEPFLVSFVVGGYFGIIERWVMQGCKDTQKDIKALVSEFAGRVLTS